MRRPIRIELISRDRFWQRAVMVEWQHQFPDRAVVPEQENFYLVEKDWIADFERVAGKCFSRIVHAPADPTRRQLFRRLFAPGARS